MDLYFGKARQDQLLQEAQLGRLLREARTDELKVRQRLLLVVGHYLATVGLRLVERATTTWSTQKG